jgi:hypothetical protein
MNEPNNSTVARRSMSAIGRMSRTGIGRATGRLSRYIGSSSAVLATGRFLRKQLWAWPIIAAILFGGAGWWVHHSVEGAMQQQRVTDLNAVVDTTVTALTTWMGEQKINVELFADDEELVRLTRELLAIDAEPSEIERQLVQSKPQAALRARLKDRLNRCGYAGYFIVARDGRVLAADQDPPVGKLLSGYRGEIANQANAGHTVVSRPFRSPLLLPDPKGEPRANLPTMFVAGPIRDIGGIIIGGLGLRIRPEDHFTRILSIAKFGDTGEVYAFDRDGLLLSQSRFDDIMKQIGLLADLPDSQSILTVEVRDPGVNLVKGERPALRRAEQPLTRMAADAVQGHDGHDADGYRGYRGVYKVGAWRWLPDYDFGVAAEADVDEAFRPVFILRRAFWTLVTLLALSAIGIFVAMLFMARQQLALQSATLAAKQLGQYKLEEKLGAGGMGTVYKARHALLRRPTAVKLLDVDKMSPAAIARFEREVQLTSALTHPNTVAVFDYGHTPEGIFYYAMEYLEGLNLDDLVLKNGPVPEGRLIYILRQVCGSLAEAHAAGMVHRDIKPANILLTRRGGIGDFVKVLDFGLAKAIDGADKANVTSPNALMGTPLYLSPEAVSRPDEVDARSDVYAVGAVGYFLLTGAPVFDGATVMEICMKHAKEAATPPSVRFDRAVSPDLERLLMRCLSKAPSDRPISAALLLRELDQCEVATTWTANDAAAWWAAHGNTVTAATKIDPMRIPETATPQTTMAYEGP